MSTDLFGAPTLIGLKVKLDRPADRERPCCNNVCTIGAGSGPHAGELTCSNCGQHRGWLSQTTAQWIEHVVTRFGAPTTPIIVRKSHTYTKRRRRTQNRTRTELEFEHQHQYRNYSYANK
jgi:hypothetical protein